MIEPERRSGTPKEIEVYDHFGRPSAQSNPPTDSKFWYAERKGPRDSPEQVYLWAKAVLRQLDRINDVRRRSREAEDDDRHFEYVDSDRFHDLWCEEPADQTFLMEAAAQMLAWAEDREKPGTRGYGLPGRDTTQWVVDLRNLLIHFDEAYRGVRGRTLKRLGDGPFPKLDYGELKQLAITAIGRVEQGLDDYAASQYAEERQGRR